MDMFREWKRGDYQKKLWNGAHQEEENKEDLKLTGRKGLEEKGLMEEDWNERGKWKKKIVIWEQEDVETSNNLLNNNNILSNDSPVSCPVIIVNCWAIPQTFFLQTVL